jgi:branched-chain amino acid transport system substrate-binding protein
MNLIRILLLLTLVAPRPTFADTPPIRIGALIVLTGQYAMQGSAFREGIELAIDEVNAGGGIHGRTLALFHL